MKKLMLIALLTFVSNVSFCQFINSVQVNGGLIFPTNAQNGLLTSFEFTHKLDESWSLYSSAGYSYFNKNTVYTDNHLDSPTSYSEDSHKLYKLVVGSKLILNTIKSFKVFADFEFGFNHLTYNEYDMVLIKDDLQRKVLSFYPDYSSRKSTSESLYGLGFGLGFTQQINSNYGFSLEYKRLIQTKNMDYFRHYYALSLGLVYNI
ncbi:MAG: hypothetical protein A2499_17795 [Stygiobacter sp. RIFOXYC12_FULL_38_8]|nr:MAG: hypothetical protein A2X62_13630 [Stygiobacter sp. GWC2_38_9]OGU77876.1 MAG: hypothetical protein A2279_07120 [Stygiobacter sp. RIFOXYA12_FULL_38_9]OGV07102.1 MAG: hypothetical protein A2299_03980 [Stygiobacter sp. RIFOXYB2_FULL_37_11]OGV11041.1 MAG: hypothetical protein A2237_01405 [Stygiobacter sp. RIFOXYA2_FULL_38_8]OGV12381.1 MAG: hypothetical protein A2440_14075 [Stygiobacter sp. RIFOXYC2_FULL_38_25]OGV25250.1 MAG: hypothetical protein A2499_17795 [Stygiobacter sp. RIFOXYC12_FULL_